MRNALGAMIPSAGVGTCLTRRLIEHFLRIRGTVLMTGCVPRGNPREVDAAVRRIGDRLLLIECFSYELPLDYEGGKPSVYDSQDGNLAS